jgi:hypothetical protein
MTSPEPEKKCSHETKFLTQKRSWADIFKNVWLFIPSKGAHMVLCEDAEEATEKALSAFRAKVHFEIWDEIDLQMRLHPTLEIIDMLNELRKTLKKRIEELKV